jgi:flagellar protein FlbC
MQKIASNVSIDSANTFLQLSSESKSSVSTSDNSGKFEDLVSFYQNKDDTSTEKSVSPKNSNENVVDFKEQNDISTEKALSKVDENKETETVNTEKNENQLNSLQSKKIIDKQEKQDKSSKLVKSDKNVKNKNKAEIENNINPHIANNLSDITEKTEIVEKKSSVNVKINNKDEKSEEINEISSENEIPQNIENLAILKNKKDVDLKDNFLNTKSDEHKNDKSEKKSTFSTETQNIKVSDLRTQNNSVTDKKQIEKQKLDIKYESSDKATITMDLSKQQTENNILSLNSQTANSDGSNFQSMLNNQIQQNASEFVKAGSIILKDNNQGTINLVLHPDDLGNIKIHLSIDGKSVAAQISVTTKEALEVFKDNAQTLREAFIESGFNTGDFDVSFSNNSNSNNNEFGEQQNSQNEFFAKQAYDNDSSADLDKSLILENQNHFTNNLINIVA